MLQPARPAEPGLPRVRQPEQELLLVHQPEQALRPVHQREEVHPRARQRGRVLQHVHQQDRVLLLARQPEAELQRVRHPDLELLLGRHPVLRHVLRAVILPNQGPVPVQRDPVIAEADTADLRAVADIADHQVAVEDTADPQEVEADSAVAQGEAVEGGSPAPSIQAAYQRRSSLLRLHSCRFSSRITPYNSRY